MSFIQSSRELTIDSVSITNPSCAGSNDGSLIPSVSGVVGNAIYNWSPCCQVGNDVTNAPNGSYSLTVIDDAPSTDSWTGLLLEPDPIEIDFIQNTVTQCNEFGSLGDPPKITPNSYYAVTVQGGVGSYSYQWSSEYGSFDNEFDLNSQYTGPSEQINYLNLTVTDDNGCSSTQQFEAVINDPYITYDFQTPTTNGGSDGVLEDIQVRGIYDPTGVGYYAWTFYDTDGVTTLDSGDSLSPIPNQNNLLAGQYSLVISFSCNGEFFLNLPDPIIIDMPTTIKYCDSSDFVTITNGQGPFTYQWYPTDLLTFPNSKLPGFQYGNFPRTYTLNVTDSNGLSTESSIQVETINLDVGTGIVSACNGSLVTLPLSVFNGISPYSFNWSPTIHLNDHTIQNPIFTSSITAQINYTVTVTDFNGCEEQATVTVISQNPQIDYTVDSLSCNENGAIRDISVSGLLSGCWSVVDESSNIINSGADLNSIPDITGLTEGRYRIEIGCNTCPFSSSYIDLIAPSEPLITMPTKIDYCNFDNSDIDITGGSPPYSYSWSPSNGVIDSTTRFPVISSDTVMPLSLTLTVTDSLGCIDQSLIELTGNSIDLNIDIIPISCDNESDAAITITSIDFSSISCSLENDVFTNEQCTLTDLSIGIYQISVLDRCNYRSDLEIEIDIPSFNDTDGDEVPNCRDECPFDVDKIKPGICGCGNSDKDEDNDGYAVCNDLCDSDPRLINETCRSTIEIPFEEEDSEMNIPTIAITIQENNLDVQFNVSQEITKLIDRIEVKALPLAEVDIDGNIIQSIDLSSIDWHNVLTLKDGYEILTSRGIARLDQSIVNLTFRHYFFRRSCMVYNNDTTEVGNYGINNKVIKCYNNSDNFLFDKSINSVFEAGDSKISFTIENWPFLSKDHLLRATYRYTSLEGLIESRHIKDYEDKAQIIYSIDTGIKLQIDFLTSSVLDNGFGPVDILTNEHGEITVLFNSFEDRLIYDPSLHFLFDDSSTEVDTDDWVTWRGPLIAIGVCSFMALLLILLVNTNNKVRRVVYGDEGMRIERLRRSMSKRESQGDFDNDEDQEEKGEEDDVNEGHEGDIEKGRENVW